MEFKASIDTLTKIITTVILALIIYFLITNKLIPGIILGVIVLFCYLWAPQKYELNDQGLKIVRLVRPKCIPIETITAVTTPDKKLTKGIIRTYGVGGLFGYFGKFYNSKLGSMDFYVTQRKNYVLLTLKSKSKIMISPDDMSLAEVLQEKVKSAQS